MDWRAIDTFVVKEHVGLFKAANEYDVFDAASGRQVFTCREPRLGFFTKILRFTDYRRMTPFDIEVRDMTGALVVRVRRPVTIGVARVSAFDGEEDLIGGFRQKWFSIGGAFRVVDAHDREVCLLKGSLLGWNFTFKSGERLLAEVKKKWAGLGKELFTSADNYALSIDPGIERDDPARELILASVLCIDMVLKE